MVAEIVRVNPTVTSINTDGIGNRFEEVWPSISGAVLNYFKKTVKASVPSLARTFFIDVKYQKIVNDPSKSRFTQMVN